MCESEEFAGDVLEAPEILGVESVCADGVTLRLLVKTGPGAQFRLQRALREAVKLAIDHAGVAGPLPTPRLTAGDARRACRAADPWPASWRSPVGTCRRSCHDDAVRDQARRKG